jgi:small conductance mechanosensitive channel
MCKLRRIPYAQRRSAQTQTSRRDGDSTVIEMDLPWTMVLAQEEAQPKVDYGKELLAKAVEWAADFVPALVGALLVLVVGVIASKILRGLFTKGMVKARVDATLSKFLSNIAYTLMVVMVAISAAGVLGVPTGSFAAVIAAGGLAIGLAMQGSLGNFAAGVLLMLFKPFKVGDFIEGAGHAGVVEEISTCMLTGDNKHIIIPNGSIMGGSIVNYSAKPTRRIDMVFGIGYGDDLKQAKAVLERVMKADARVLAEPATTIAVSELGESSVNFVVRPWVKTEDYWPCRFDVIEAVKAEFDKEGISIPFPQRDVHMHQVA